MQIQPINQTSLDAKRFRMPVKVETYERGGNNSIDVRRLPGKWVAEYSNPNAEFFYKQAQKTKNWRKKLELYKQMGQPELKDVSISARLKNWYEKNILKRILKDEW